MLAAAVLYVQVQRPSPAKLQHSLEKGLNDLDVAVLRRAGPPKVAVRFIKESLRYGTRGVIHDYRVFGVRWGFRLEDVGIDIHVLQGSADTLVPRRYCELLAERLPQSQLTICPGEGHISLMRNHCKEIMEALVT